MNKLCLNCQKPITSKRGGAKFCGEECKNAYHNKQRPKTGRLSGLPLKPASHVIKKPLNLSPALGGVEKSIPPIDKSTTAKTPGPVNPAGSTLPVLKPEPLVFSNVIYSHTGLPVNEKPKPETPIVLPPKHLPKIEIDPNPDYTDLQNRIAVIDAKRAQLAKSIEKIRTRIAEVQANDGSSSVVIGAGAGALLGYHAGSGETRSKGHGGGGWLLVILCGIAGAAAGNGFRSITQKAREQANVQALLQLNALLSEALKRDEWLKLEKSRLSIQTLGMPMTIAKEVKVLNPAYAPALKSWQEQQARLEKAAQNNGLGSPYPKGEDPHETGRILSAAAMSQLSTVILDFKEPWLTLLGKPQTNFKMLVYGESGSGKSHFAIQLAMYLAGFGRVLYVSGEEGFATTFQDKIRTMGADRHPNFYTGDFRTGTELLAEAPNLYHFIVIDSINDMGISYEQYLQIIERFNQSGVVALFQSTKAGKFRGSNEFIHKSDIAVKVENGIATTVKNRYKAAGETFDVMKVYKP